MTIKRSLPSMKDALSIPDVNPSSRTVKAFSYSENSAAYRRNESPGWKERVDARIALLR